MVGEHTRAKGPAIYLTRQSVEPAPSIKLVEGSLVIGRDAGCDLVVPHEAVSRRHAMLTLAGDALSVEDLKSMNGTFLDGERIAAGRILPGQVLQIGPTRFVVSESPAHNHDLTTETFGRTANKGVQRLSPAELRVLQYLLEGLSQKQIANSLGVSQHTIHAQVRSIYERLGVHSRGELMALFVDPGDADRLLE